MGPLIQIWPWLGYKFPFILTPPALKAKGRPDLLFWLAVKGHSLAAVS